MVHGCGGSGSIMDEPRSKPRPVLSSPMSHVRLRHSCASAVHGGSWLEPWLGPREPAGRGSGHWRPEQVKRWAGVMACVRAARLGFAWAWAGSTGSVWWVRLDRHIPRVIGGIPDANDAILDHERLSKRLMAYGLAELQIEGDGNCQFRAIADQLLKNPEYHKFVRKEVVKQLKLHRNLYESYVPMKYRRYVRKMKRSSEWGDHITLQAAADRFEARICLVTSFRDTCFIEILPKEKNPLRDLWLSFWSEVHYNSLYQAGEIPPRVHRKKHWLF
ncbi:hypothetical protein F511_02662 [Dorcoceras hygrometricum]|uniref:ubiquitinyl hydrolase 1 n=1 Tax=Dorcoceras hygrometricum TaxID=472368 RepID=A0A2Z7DB70_9LAMI|nr:hypothetical protein F511_02662 [Dorcoceras hygrometricum]